MDINLIVGIVATIVSGIGLTKGFWDSLEIDIQIKKNSSPK